MDFREPKLDFPRKKNLVKVTDLLGAVGSFVDGYVTNNQSGIKGSSDSDELVTAWWDRNLIYTTKRRIATVSLYPCQPIFTGSAQNLKT
ncbi:unnamed protein product, partial [Nesidiocoris tenuis]